MKFIPKIAVPALAFALLAGGASAATFTFTEGNGDNRKRVAESIDLEDADLTTPGFQLDALTGHAGGLDQDDVIQLHGRIVSSQDVFTYTFAFSGDFKVEFDLDGYLLADGFTSSDGDQSEELSGLVGQDGRFGNPQADLLPVKGVEFRLSDGVTTQTRKFLTDVLDGDDPFIFAGVGGIEYTLTVDGSVGPASGADALYDLKISAVPVPAAGLLLLGGIGSLAALRRRKQKAAS